MKFQIRLFSLIATLVVYFTAATAQANDTHLFEDFTLQGEKGTTYSLSAFKGKPVILHFWASWCPYCKKLQPTLQQFHDKYKDEGLVVLGINMREFLTVNPYQVLAERGYTFPTAVKGEALAAQHKVIGTPTTFFINRNGELVHRTSKSAPNDEGILTAVKDIMATQK